MAAAAVGRLWHAAVIFTSYQREAASSPASSEQASRPLGEVNVETGGSPLAFQNGRSFGTIVFFFFLKKGRLGDV